MVGNRGPSKERDVTKSAAVRECTTRGQHSRQCWASGQARALYLQQARVIYRAREHLARRQGKLMTRCGACLTSFAIRAILVTSVLPAATCPSGGARFSESLWRWCQVKTAVEETRRMEWEDRADPWAVMSRVGRLFSVGRSGCTRPKSEEGGER